MAGRLIRIGVLGCGNVGASFVELVAERSKEIEARTGVQLEVVRIAVRNLARSRDVEIVGIASSPEFVFAVAPGALLPEPDRFGVVWMGREALGRAFEALVRARIDG